VVVQGMCGIVTGVVWDGCRGDGGQLGWLRKCGMVMEFNNNSSGSVGISDGGDGAQFQWSRECEI
jgi:hypothetical protein